MKRFMRKDHADILKRQFMSIDLEDDIVIGLYNMHALPQNVFSHQDSMRNHSVPPFGMEAKNGKCAGQAAS